MVYWLRNIVAYCVAAIAATALAEWVQSAVVAEVLIPNLITIVLALLAINVQTTAVLAVKLREIAMLQEIDFSRTVMQFQIAFYEQGCLLIASLILVAISKSHLAVFNEQLLGCASFFVFFASLHIFIDTSIGVLCCLFPRQHE